MLGDSFEQVKQQAAAHEEDIRKFYRLLAHEHQTEIRSWQRDGSRPQSDFVSTEDEFVSSVIKLVGCGRSVYAGLNERCASGTKDVDVTAWGCEFVDVDLHGEFNTSENWRKTSLFLDSVREVFEKQGIHASVVNSGGGLQVFIPFSHIKIDSESKRDDVKHLKDRFKAFVACNFSKPFFSLDEKVFNLSRVARVVGSYNFSAGKFSSFVNYEGFAANDAFVDAVKKLPSPKRAKVLLCDVDIALRRCDFLEKVCCVKKFPSGTNRHSILSKNLAIYTRGSAARAPLREQYLRVQEKPVTEFDGWDAAAREKKFVTFNCWELIKYQRSVGQVYEFCDICPFNNFNYKLPEGAIRTIAGAEKELRPTKLEVVDKFYERVQPRNSPNSYNYDVLYRLYLISIAKNNAAKFLVTDSSQHVRVGCNDDIYVMGLRPGDALFSSLESNLPELHVVEDMLKKCKCPKPLYATMDEMVHLLFNLHANSGVFLQFTTPLSAEELLEHSNEELEKIVERYITLGLCKDERIVEIFKVDLFVPNKNIVASASFQFYSPHKFLYTNSKAGKSTTADLLGTRAERTTVSNLLGFSTSDEVNYGSMDGDVLPRYLDEVQEEKSDKTYGKLLGVMECGHVRIDVGKKSITCDTHSSLNFLGNPSEDVEEYAKSEVELVQKLEDTIKKITTNCEALGSRVGVFVFDSKFEVVSGVACSAEEREQLTAAVTSIRELSSAAFSKLFLDEKILSFLNEEFSPQYLKKLGVFIDHINLLTIKSFLRGQRNSYRHLNGAALRLACVKHIRELVSGDVDVDSLIACARERLRELQELNLRSYERLISSGVDSALRTLYKQRFEEETDYMKVLLRAIFSYASAVDLKEKNYFPVESLRELVNEDEERPETIYFNALLERVNYRRLKDVYRVERADFGGVDVFVVLDFSSLNYIFGPQPKKLSEEGKIFATQETLSSEHDEVASEKIVREGKQ